MTRRSRSVGPYPAHLLQPQNPPRDKVTIDPERSVRLRRRLDADLLREECRDDWRLRSDTPDYGANYHAPAPDPKLDARFANAPLRCELCGRAEKSGGLCAGCGDVWNLGDER